MNARVAGAQAAEEEPFFFVLNDDTVECVACYENAGYGPADEENKLIMSVSETGTCGCCGVWSVTQELSPVRYSAGMFYRILDKIADVFTAIGMASHEAKHGGYIGCDSNRDLDRRLP